MRERPILFSGEMVRAILAGRKTQTRRTCSSARWWRYVEFIGGKDDNHNDPALWGYADEYGDYWTLAGDGAGNALPCPYGRVGDRLWVREMWRSWDETCVDDGSAGHIEDEEPCGPHCNQTYVAYAATPRDGYRPKPDGARITYLDESTPLDSNPQLLGPWRPSIFMPRWASRIALEITGVSVHRLQEISNDDIAAEGTPGLHPCGGAFPTQWRERWISLWNAINGKRAPWASNPWVWAVSFRRAA